MARKPPWLTAGAVAVLVVADLVLVWLALQHVGDDGDRSPTDGARPASGPESAAPPAGTTRPPTTGPVLLDAAADGTVVRAARGRCTAAGGGVQPLSGVEVSTDGGRSFERADVGDELTDVLRVSATSARDISVVGVGSTCAKAVYRSDDGGQSWAASPGASDVWHLSLTDVDSVHAPTGRVATGCEVRALSTVGKAVARVLCNDDALRGTADGGVTWVLLGELGGAVDVAYTTTADAWALATTADCAAATWRTEDGGVDWRQTGCVAAGADPQALSAAGDLQAVQVGGRMLVSTDQGRTFARP